MDLVELEMDLVELEIGSVAVNETVVMRSRFILGG